MKYTLRFTEERDRNSPLVEMASGVVEGSDIPRIGDMILYQKHRKAQILRGEVYEVARRVVGRESERCLPHQYAPTVMAVLLEKIGEESNET